MTFTVSRLIMSVLLPIIIFREEGEVLIETYRMNALNVCFFSAAIQPLKTRL